MRVVQLKRVQHGGQQVEVSSWMQQHTAAIVKRDAGRLWLMNQSCH
jgi:hypothetical protein